MNKQRCLAIIEMVFEFINISTNPYKWPDRLRKIFVLTIIISGPLWIAFNSLIIAIGLITATIIAIIVNIFNSLKRLWDGEHD